MIHSTHNNLSREQWLSVRRLENQMFKNSVKRDAKSHMLSRKTVRITNKQLKIDKFLNLNLLLLISLILVLVLSACGSDDETPIQEPQSDTSVATPTNEEKITLGVISGEPSKSIRERQGFVDYLADNLVEFGIKIGEVRVTSDMEVMGQWLASGEVDIMMDSFYPAAIVSEISGASPILFRQRDRDDKSAVFFAHVDSGITTFEELSGHIIVFEEPDSTSGFLLPMFYLIEAGMTPIEVSQPDAPVDSDKVGYVFSGDDDAVVQWILSGRALAGAAQDNTFSNFFEENSDVLVPLLETEPIIRDQSFLIGASVSPDLRNAFKDLMLNLDDTEEGRAILEELETAQFAELSPARQADFDRAQEMFDTINN